MVRLPGLLAFLLTVTRLMRVQHGFQLAPFIGRPFVTRRLRVETGFAGLHTRERVSGASCRRPNQRTGNESHQPLTQPRQDVRQRQPVEHVFAQVLEQPVAGPPAASMPTGPA